MTRAPNVLCIRRVWVLGVVLIVGCSRSTSSEPSITVSTDKERTPAASAAKQQSDTRRHVFSFDASGRTTRTGAQFVSFQVFTSEDGVTVRRFIENYRSPAQASRRFAKLVASPNRLVEPQSKVEFDGTVGERAVLILPKRMGDYSGTLIVWNRGDQVEVFESSSLPHLYEFERQVLAP